VYDLILNSTSTSPQAIAESIVTAATK
jgi:hypothetical protein